MRSNRTIAFRLSAAVLSVAVGLVAFSDGVAAKEQDKSKARKLDVAGAPIKPATSAMELRRTNVVMQQFDFSCGAGALATLLNGYFGERYTELQILKIGEKRYPPNIWKIKLKIGLSLDDLAFIANKLGYEAEGAQIGLAALLQVNGPVIVHGNKIKGITHFSVFRGAKNGVIHLADPAIGNTTYSPEEFVKYYTGYALAVWRKGAKLPANYPIALAEKDERDELRAARDVAGSRPEFLPGPY